MADRWAVTALADSIATVDGVRRCRVSLYSLRITVDLSQEGSLLDRRTFGYVEAILEGRPSPCRLPVGSPLARPVQVRGCNRLAFILLGGNAFALSVVGRVIPGTPSVPFLVASGYYLARSSPCLDDRLRHTPFFGPILREWVSQAALSSASKGKMLRLTVTIVAVTAFLAPLSPASLGLILLISSLSVHGIAQPSTLTDRGHATTCASLGTPRPLSTS